MKTRRYSISIAVVALLGVAAVSARWLGSLRPDSPELKASRIIVVLSGADHGSGTLRDAIFAAARFGERTRIVLRPRQITLRSPLPPLVSVGGMILDGAESHCIIDGAAVPSGTLIDIASPNSMILGCTITNAREKGVWVRASSVTVRSSTFTHCGDGVAILPGATTAVVERSHFAANGTGVRVNAEARGTVVRDNDFSRHDQAGVWIAGSAPVADASPRVAVQRNRFRADRIAIAVINSPALAEENLVQEQREMGIYLFGSPGIVRNNRLVGGATGIVVDSSSAAVVEGNEIGRQTSVGLLVRSSRRSVVQRNRLYSNAYGIVVVFGDRSDPDFIRDNLVTSSGFDGIYLVGSSPLLRGNQVLQSRAAAARVLDYVPLTGARLTAEPRFEENTFRMNRFDAPIRGEYRQPKEDTSG